MRSSGRSLRPQEASFDRAENFGVDCIGRAKGANFRIEAFYPHPVGLPRELIVDFCGGFEMSDVRFKNIAPKLRVVARAFLADESMRFGYRKAKVDHKIFCGQRVDLIFKLLEPLDKFAAFLSSNASTLVREIRADVAVGEHRVPGSQLGFDPGLRFVAIAGVKKRGEVSVDCVERPEVAIQKARDKLAKKSVIAREADLAEWDVALGKRAGEHVELRPFSGAVNSFEDDEFSARCHRVKESLADSQDALLQ
jgi:hypothetical protein